MNYFNSNGELRAEDMIRNKIAIQHVLFFGREGPLYTRYDGERRYHRGTVCEFRFTPKGNLSVALPGEDKRKQLPLNTDNVTWWYDKGDAPHRIPIAREHNQGLLVFNSWAANQLEQLFKDMAKHDAHFNGNEMYVWRLICNLVDNNMSDENVEFTEMFVRNAKHFVASGNAYNLRNVIYQVKALGHAMQVPSAEILRRLGNGKIK